MSNVNPLVALFAGGQFLENIPVAEARAVIGVPHDIESDTEEDGKCKFTFKDHLLPTLRPCRCSWEIKEEVEGGDSNEYRRAKEVQSRY